MVLLGALGTIHSNHGRVPDESEPTNHMICVGEKKLKAEVVVIFTIGNKDRII